MKKFLTSVFVLCAALTVQAALHLTIDQVINDEEVTTEITQDTTIRVTEYEWDEDMEEALLEVRGQLYSDESQNIIVTITRSNEGIIDQLCAAGNCVPGNGELSQVCEFTIGSLPMQRSWFTHYTTWEEGTETIAYAFNDGVNPTLTLTIHYSYKDDNTAVENVVVLPTNNYIYSLLGQRMHTNNWNELPSGIYIINGKKVMVR